MRTCICVSRTYGSKGRETSENMAERLVLPCHDRVLISEAISKGGVDTSVFDRTRTKEADRWLYEHLYDADAIDESGMSPQEMFLNSTKKVIVELAKASDCVFVGRSAAQILKDNYPECRVISVFITATSEDRIAEIMRRWDEGEVAARRRLRKIDGLRKDCFEYYRSDEEVEKDSTWGDPALYDACFNTSLLSKDKIADAIEAIYRKSGD
ncbi:cytidylate kinase-like family protein [Aminicella lysinilytica]|uniref:cytidylate kinase-like family protein n=1 Tax=Aminicella lysinilytica TaxID=433323 RepID=UPI0026EB7CF5|nr:cytidylate kinase-like family protein [Aminicella lysinilytica]